MQSNFLIVAADGRVREILAGDLRAQGYKVTLAENGAEAARVAETVSVDSVLVESHLPDMTPVELRDRILRARPECRVVVLTSFGQVRNSPELLRFGGDDFLVRSGQLLDLLRAPEEASGQAVPVSRYEQGWQSLLFTIDTLVGLLELDRREFAISSHQVMQLARATADEMGGDFEMMQEVMLGALLRDVGRSALEPSAVAEVGVNEDDQHEVITEHVEASLRLFEHIDFPLKVLPVVRHHHERYNGTGAPDGLRGREIPMGARILAVVDAYVELTSGRGTDSLDPETALQELVNRSGHQFDPEVVEAFHRVMDKRLAGRRGKSKPTVLVVEQSEQFRRLLTMRLRNEGYAVDEAEGYERALERLLMEPPDLVVVDIDIDPGEAFGLLQEMQIDGNLCQVPIAFASQGNDRMIRLRALRQGVDDFLCKADEMEETIARIENILLREAIRAEGVVRRSKRGITGSLENLSLPDIVQTLSIGMKTACVSLSTDSKNGKIWFDSGAPVHAETDSQQSDEAFFEMVRWKSGEFVIEHGVKSKTSTMDQDAMFLLMEGLRLMDESTVDPEQAVS